MSGPLERYRTQLEAGTIEPDPAQELVLREFERLYNELVHAGGQQRQPQG